MSRNVYDSLAEKPRPVRSAADSSTPCERAFEMLSVRYWLASPSAVPTATMRFVVAVVEGRGAEQQALVGDRLIDAGLDAAAPLGLEVRIVGERDLERVRRPDATASGGVDPRVSDEA